MTKITDKDRMDWLEENTIRVILSGDNYYNSPDEPGTFREHIDKQIMDQIKYEQIQTDRQENSQ